MKMQKILKLIMIHGLLSYSSVFYWLNNLLLRNVESKVSPAEDY